MSDSSKPNAGRSLRPWLNSAPLNALRQEMNDMLENVFGDSMPSFRSESGPKVDVCETADAVEVTTDLPGIKPDEVDIDIVDSCLTITVNRKQETVEADPDRKFHRVERQTGNVTRSVFLPCPIKEENTDASLADGVLTIRLPKHEEAKRHRVPVRGNDSPPTQL